MQDSEGDDLSTGKARGTRRLARLGPLGLAAVGLWLLLVPAACLVAAGLLARQSAQEAALATEAARSLAEFETAQAALRSPTPEASAAPDLVDFPATWAAGTRLAPEVTATASTGAEPTGTPTRAPSSTLTPTPTSTSTGTVAPTEALSATQPDELVIGHSVAGRPLTVTQFGTGPVVRLIVAGIHGGNEWNTTALAHELIAYLRKEPARVPEEVTLFVLPLLNPDGAARGTDIYARANDNNVDLNRNWPSRWQADWSRDGCWKYLRLSGGTHGGSEPETQALMQFMLDYGVDAVISYHSAALGIFAGGQPPDDASLRLAGEVAAVSDYPYPPLDYGCIYTGQLIDWASEQGIAALDIELTNHRDTDFDQNCLILDIFLQWRRN